MIFEKESENDGERGRGQKRSKARARQAGAIGRLQIRARVSDRHTGVPPGVRGRAGVRP